MRKQIGKVVLDYTYYAGEDLYSDGDIEDVLLDIVKKGIQDEVLYSDNRWPVIYHLSNIRENILEWYPLKKNADVLEIGSGCGAVTGLLSRKAKHVTCIELSEKRSIINAYRNSGCTNVEILIGNFQEIKINKKFDYITLIGVWEYSGMYVNDKNPYIGMLKKIKDYLKEDGKIFIAIENKMGLKYWNGAAEDHTGNLYDGINDYVNTNRKVRTFSRPEIENIFKKAGIQEYKFYYPMPDYKLPETVYSDSFLPVPGMEHNYAKDYSASRIYQFNDAVITDQISEDKMFPYFANSFLVVAGKDDTGMQYIKYNRCRKEEFRIKTELCYKNNEKYVKKQALDKQAEEHILHMKEKEEKWNGSLPNLHCIKGYIEEGAYITPFIEGEDLEACFYKYRNDAELFIQKFCYYVKEYLTPDEKSFVSFYPTEEFYSVFGKVYPEGQKTLAYTNTDLIFSNLKLTPDGEMYCFDYEWVFDFPVPYDYVIWKCAIQLYTKYTAYLMKYFSKKEFLIRAGIEEKNLAVFLEMDNHFAEYVFGQKQKECYLKNYRQTVIRQTMRLI